MPYHVFVGYDSREQAAYDVCVASLTAHNTGSDQDIIVHRLEHRQLRAQDLFDRPWRIDEKGQFWDDRDGRPFSTEFSHSRFLVPTLAKQLGIHSPVMFVDCDFMFLAPVQGIFHKVRATVPLADGSHPLWVVKHKFSKANEGVKMDGMVQQAYPRKLWSSLMVFDMRFGAEWFPDARQANHDTGTSLHGFQRYGDNPMDDVLIGELAGAWNWIPGHSPPLARPCAVHWSLGGPWMEGYEDTPFAAEWREAHRRVLLAQAGSVPSYIKVA